MCFHVDIRYDGRVNQAKDHRIDPRCFSEKYYEANYRQRLAAYKSSAAVRKYEFSLGDQLAIELFSADCHYCKWPGPNGIDRVDNSLGYTASNSVSCCRFCNLAKGTQDALLLQEWVKHVKSQADLKPKIPVLRWHNDDVQYAVRTGIVRRRARSG